jgi:uncharacterized protein with PIN domain
MSLKVRCDFCNEIVSFDDVDQVILQLEKNAAVNKEFAFRCKNCKEQEKNETLTGQKIRVQRYS